MQVIKVEGVTYLGTYDPEINQIDKAMNISGIIDISQRTFDKYVKENNIGNTETIILDNNAGKVIRNLNDEEQNSMAIAEFTMVRAKKVSMAHWQNEIFDKLNGDKVEFVKPKVRKGHSPF